MPNHPKMPHRTIRVPDDLWHAAQGVADYYGVTLSQVIRSELGAWVEAMTPGVVR